MVKELLQETLCCLLTENIIKVVIRKSKVRLCDDVDLYLSGSGFVLVLNFISCFTSKVYLCLDFPSIIFPDPFQLHLCPIFACVLTGLSRLFCVPATSFLWLFRTTLWSQLSPHPARKVISAPQPAHLVPVTVPAPASSVPGSCLISQHRLVLLWIFSTLRTAYCTLQRYNYDRRGLASLQSWSNLKDNVWTIWKPKNVTMTSLKTYFQEE